MHDPSDSSRKLTALVDSGAEFESFVAQALPELLDRATAQTRRFLRETDQWIDDIVHEKLALRWGYELTERFLAYARTELPCRPVLLLDSFIARYLSKPDPFCYHPDLCTLLGRLLDGLAARAVVSRDALMALFHHLYGFGPGQVVRLLGFGPEESQRIYKNFERWRRTGWERATAEMGVTECELRELEEQVRRDRAGLNQEAERLARLIQAHYRKSEPDHFPCKSRPEWERLFEENYGYDYRVWHLAFCTDCLGEVYAFRQDGRPVVGALQPSGPLQMDLQLRPWQRRGLRLIVSRGGQNGTARRASHRLPAASHRSAG